MNLLSASARLLLIEYAAFDNPAYHKWTDSVDTVDYIDCGYATNMTRGAVVYMAASDGLLAVSRTRTDPWPVQRMRAKYLHSPRYFGIFVSYFFQSTLLRDLCL